jgi:agmatinase
MTFLGLREDWDSAQALILPVPYEATTSYGKGTAMGPDALLKASAYVELYNEVLGYEPAAVDSGSPRACDNDVLSRYFTLPPLPVSSVGQPAMDLIHQTAKSLVMKDRFLLSIGGEHSITAPLVAAHLPLYPSLHVLQIDAHADLRNSYEGSELSHASAMARVVELVDNRLTQVGIRSICAEDAEQIRTRRLHTFFAHGLQGKTTQEWVSEVIDTLGAWVYLTVDVDGLDPSVVPFTGTPEPGGLGWWETVELIRCLGEERHIVGADVVKLSVTGAVEADRRSAFNVAKLAYQILDAALLEK